MPVFSLSRHLYQAHHCVQVRAKFTGVLNGIDSVEWDPAADPLLPANFSPTQPAGKALCKQYLQVCAWAAALVAGLSEC